MMPEYDYLLIRMGICQFEPHRNLIYTTKCLKQGVEETQFYFST